MQTTHFAAVLGQACQIAGAALRRSLAPACVFTCAQLTFGQAQFIPLGGSPGSPIYAISISGDGHVVVGYDTIPSGCVNQASRWTAQGGWQGIGDVPGGVCESYAHGVSFDGAVVVGTGQDGSCYKAYRWTAAAGLQPLPWGAGAWCGGAGGVSGDGAITVGGRALNSGGSHACYWTSTGTLVDLGELPGGAVGAEASDASFHGAVIVGGSASAGGGDEAFVWTAAAGMVGLGDLPGGSFGSSARAVSSDGSAVVGWASSAVGREAMLWTASTGLVGLGDLPGGSFSSEANDVSANGAAIVGHSSGANGVEAFLWTQPLGMVALKDHLLAMGVTGLTGWTLLRATGVSDDARVLCGDGLNPNGDGEPWIAMLAPPSHSTYCTVGVSSNFCTPSISGSGAPSATAAAGFTIAMGSVDGQRQGLLFYGVDNSGFAPAPWGSSGAYLCVKGPTQRTLVQNTGGTAGACSGSLALDWNAFRTANPGALGAPFAVGQHVYAQGWFRDPPSPKTTMLSNALEFIVQP